jgi:hypothetical protein
MENVWDKSRKRWPPLNVICYISELVIDCSQKEGVYKSLWGLTLVKPHTNVFFAYMENLGDKSRKRWPPLNVIVTFLN